jgi:release factor glutamine methyltransferase
MTVQEALAIGRGRLANSPSPALDARLLLEHVLAVEHSYLIAHSDRLLTLYQEEEYRSLVKRAAQREPIPYLTGHAPFYGLDFTVNPDVLIPRPESELIVEEVLSWVGQRSVMEPNQEKPLGVVEVGTGSGCIAVIMALKLPGSTIEATDICSAALAIARQNAQRYGVTERIDFLHGSLLEPTATRPDLIVANLPYIADHEWTALDDSVKLYEPDLALRGGSDGLDSIRQLLNQATSILAPGGAIFLEIGWQQGTSVKHLAQMSFPTAEVKVRPDFAGHDRVVSITNRGIHSPAGSE